ncbi:4-hydroxy-tetrahydrodipicolinate reductase [Natrarchaeobius chitinivorans]|uniref:4-hydroxy-tetrahydrodipicolinate reductase n=1 Tax=Natrarchaeobius chitinivorans TaxID=1679083 RepID=A0A3N6LUK3_NATCH|nr:4-hydroxy-tetrahydrodipicolinate reductase [Natrarchaeobius chitinivorans]RQG92347.1 4-hydroxy-tetrahydrodipicolinate reductase [Natrarchaeobius chitinivorans]
MTVRIGVTGATGRMGREVIDAVGDREDCEVVFAVTRDPDGRSVGGIEVEPDGEFDSLVVEREPTVVVDFTAPGSAVDYARSCAGAGVAFVTGTTGFDDEGFEALADAAEDVPVLRAPNFARGVEALVNVVGEAIGNLPGYDVELVETHHNDKVDAPSGTAKRLLSEIEASGDFAGRTHGREGDQPREAGEIGVHALRAGDVTGEHEIIIANNHEEVRLTHRAEDRGVFAAGAVDAAVWLAGRDAGLYEFGDVVAD